MFFSNFIDTSSILKKLNMMTLWNINILKFTHESTKVEPKK